MKYKIGDKVKIINTRGIEPSEMGQMGRIKRFAFAYNNDNNIVVVDMGRGRRKRGPQTCWWINEKCLELAFKKGQQLLFSFMEQT